jgi:beta-lactam-binding protein with PASTA domain
VDTTQQPACLPNSFTLPNHIAIVNFVAGTEPTKVCTSPDSLQDVLVPSVVGFDKTQASQTLQDAGFFVKAVGEASTQPAGTVIYQNPAAGTSAQQTSVVTITVAKPAST